MSILSDRTIALKDVIHAGNHSDGLAVLSVMYNIQDEPNRALNVITEVLEYVQQEKQSTNLLHPLRLSKLMPKVMTFNIV